MQSTLIVKKKLEGDRPICFYQLPFDSEIVGALFLVHSLSYSPNFLQSSCIILIITKNKTKS